MFGGSEVGNRMWDAECGVLLQATFDVQLAPYARWGFFGVACCRSANHTRGTIPSLDGRGQGEGERYAEPHTDGEPLLSLIARRSPLPITLTQFAPLTDLSRQGRGGFLGALGLVRISSDLFGFIWTGGGGTIPSLDGRGQGEGERFGAAEGEPPTRRRAGGLPLPLTPTQFAPLTDLSRQGRGGFEGMDLGSIAARGAIYTPTVPNFIFVKLRICTTVKPIRIAPMTHAAAVA